ncbi:[acyl-carrier-protein] S-malonyltransferase [Terribacillus halophilus]|uniref:Malonyl CoA-acyl carrier protein transacylase n=1 Tax=Terribacillus halophilus TaxID=361279 RepID=A0A1G6NAV1_9BACI|nr:ACP S-malonyltransferase [Terribacillus halophilus]SDC64305.1 [acyl-carrier-protein] S-malonyltransferase [Terribacillus halophilus]
MKRVAFVFPGQGSQAVGMGQDMYNAYEEVKSLFQAADERLPQPITPLMFEGPAEELTKTENAQPALLLTSAAIYQVLQNEGVRPVVTAGHSLGEYSALVAAGVLRAEEAAVLVNKRGQLMEKAYPAGQGSMAAVLGLSLEAIQDVLETVDKEHGEIVDAANINCPGQVVISGTKKGIELAEPLLKEAGAKRVLMLNVSGPFHSRLMKQAAEEFASVLGDVEKADASIPVYANVTAEKVLDQKEIEQLLVQQLYSPVRFEETVVNMLQNDELDAIVEVGNGKVLSGLVKKINRRTTTFNVQDPESLQAFLAWYKEEE